MSDFLTNFRSLFSEEERNSELYRILATIGVNTEKTILEELNAEIRRSAEITLFSEDRLRSWLSFFLTPVRNAVSATGFGRVVVNSIDGGRSSFATVKAGSIVIGSNGMEYQIQNDLSLYLGGSTPFTFVQGTESSFSTRYSEFIAIPIKTGSVDLSYVRVFMDGTEVPLVSSFPEYPVDLETVFPDLSSTVTNYIGGVVNKVSVWNPLLNNIESLWDSVKGVSIRPQCGFFPFFFNNTLFIKIYSGGSLGSFNYVADPSNKSVEVVYRISDGAFGNLGKNQLESFKDSISTEDGGSVSVTLYNDETVNGANSPSRAELVNSLRRRFFASSHVSSVPEYTTWFLSQPTIGDCLVVSDFERWRLQGKKTFTGFDISGAVDVYLIDSLGKPIIPRESISSHYSSLIEELDNKLSLVRDIAFLKYETPEEYYHYYVVKYRSVSSEVEFSLNAKNALLDLYSISWVRSNGSSLFRDLSTDYVTKAIAGDSDISGLRVSPYHYHEHYNDVFFSESAYVVFIEHYYGEKAGGWYEYWEMDDSGELGHFEGRENNELTDFVIGTPCALYKEYVDLFGVCTIYRYHVEPTLDGSEVVGWHWGDLWSNDTALSRAGGRFDGKISFDFCGLARGVLRCFWCLENEGLIPVGGNSSSSFGIRKLPSEASVEDGSCYFGEAVRFEKYL